MHRHLPTSFVVALVVIACSSDDSDTQGSGGLGNEDTAADAGVEIMFPNGDGASAGGGGGDDAAGSDSGPASGGDTGGGADGDGDGTCNTFGCPCGSNADCLDELCVEGVDGRVCSRPCVTECPDAAFACVPIVLGGSDPFNACVPLHPNLCKPCRDDAECKNELQPNATALCLPAPDPKDGSFCASSCATTPCPDGYTCGDVALAGGGSAKQCIPSDGTCECRPSWASMNLTTDCYRENATGTCGGERTCGLEGLTACDALTAADETCNGLDDDCDGATDDIAAVTCTQADNGIGACPGVTTCDGDAEVCAGTAADNEACNALDDDCDGATDEDTCGDGLACTDDVCTGAGGACENPIQPGQCLIDGKCVAEDEPNPGFPCQRCVTAVSQTSWTGSDDGPSCYIGGECWPAGAGKPDEPCLRCRPEVSTTTWSPAAADSAIACDDGNACTRDDTCNGGACLGTAYTCDDGKACTDNVCDGAGGCGYPVVGGSCLIDGTCFAADARPDEMTCRVCDPAASATAWSPPAAAIGCDDGEPCTRDDVCAGATCGGTSYACDDMTACTIDACDGAGGCSHTTADDFCMIDGDCFADGAVDPENGCQACKVAASDSAWTPYAAAENVACDDANDCTHDDACTAAQCLGKPYSCGDGQPCTGDVCDGAGGCDYPVVAGNCFIDGACYADGARRSSAACDVCDDALSQTAWSPVSAGLGASCDDADACTSADKCDGFDCEGTPYSCDDGAACTLDACHGGGKSDCTHALQAGFCLIDGDCYADGAANPENACLVCDTDVSPLFWSAKPNGAACDDGDACSYGDQCSFGSCLAIPYDCIDRGCCVGDGTCTSSPPIGVVEQCQNGVDDDCDGVTDEGQPEVCGDGTDNDCDGDTDESGNTWGEVFFARYWRENVANGTVAIYTSEYDGTFEAPKIVDFPTDRTLSIAGVGDFDADRFNDLLVSQSVYGADYDACLATADCPAGESCVGGGCTPHDCTNVGCSGAQGTTCLDMFEHHDVYVENFVCMPPTRYYLARETCPDGAVGLDELFTLPPGDVVRAIIDVDNDGHLDLVVNKHWAARRGYVMLNAGDPGDLSFTKVEYRADGTTPTLPMPGSAPGVTPIVSPCTWVYNIAKTSKDLNGDGIVDLLGVCNPNGGSTPPKLWWWKGRGDGSFEPYQQFLDLSGSGTTPFGLQTMNDFNRDGTQDIVGGMDDDGNSGTIWPILHRSAQSQNHWLAGSLAYDVMPTLFTAEGPGAGGGTSGDFDRDGYADLLVGWAPNRAECQPGAQGPNCAYSDLAVLTNVTDNPCGPGQRCNASSQCEACFGACLINAQCGSDGCGGTCGAGCSPNQICQHNTCVDREGCVASCAGKACGDNGCGGVCGICADGQSCKAGQCVASNTCGTCTGKACGTDDCGMPCVVFDETYAIASDTNGRAGEAPTNVPPTAPTARVQPQTPGDGQDLVCTVTAQSYDLDPVQYLYRWYRKPAGQSETFQGLVSNRPVVPASMTQPGDQWRCEVTATDRLEYSPRASSAPVTILGGISPADPR